MQESKKVYRPNVSGISEVITKMANSNESRRNPMNYELVTNFSVARLSVYQQAVTEYSNVYNDDSLHIFDKAFDNNGRILIDQYSLRQTESKDLSNFWKIFKGIDYRHERMHPFNDESLNQE